MSSTRRGPARQGHLRSSKFRDNYDRERPQAAPGNPKGERLGKASCGMKQSRGTAPAPPTAWAVLLAQTAALGHHEAHSSQHASLVGHRRRSGFQLPCLLSA